MSNSANGVVLNLMRVIAQLNLSIFLVGMLFLVNVKVAIQIFSFFSIVVLLLLFIAKQFIIRYSSQRLRSDAARYKAVGEVFGAVKDVKVSSLEKIYIKKFTSAAQEFVQAISLQRLLSFFPKIVLEGLIFSGVILYLLFLSEIIIISKILFL